MTAVTHWETFEIEPGEISLRSIQAGVSGRTVDALELICRAFALNLSVVLAEVSGDGYVWRFRRTPEGLAYREIKPGNADMSPSPWREIPAPRRDSGRIRNNTDHGK
jgi:hypothetical protein